MTLYLYLWVALGSAIGGCLRYALGRAIVDNSTTFPWSTMLINILGSFVMGFFGTLTLAGSRFAVPEPVRIFIMIGVCGGFTTFSAFSLQTYDLMRSGDWPRALANVALSVLLCLGAVALGHLAAFPANHAVAVAQTADEEYTS
jgi:fluoride exporter